MKHEFSIVLVRPRYEGNIGAVARAMKNMGFDRLILVAPETDPFCPKEEARAITGKDLLKKALIFQDLREAIAESHFVVGTCGRSRNSPLLPITPREWAFQLKRLKPKRISLVFGNETNGLDNDELLLCDTLVEIPTIKGYSSINLSHAAIIVLYEMFLSNGNLKQRTPLKQVATASQRETMFEHLKEALLAIHFLEEQNPTRMMKEIRTILNRVQLDTREVNIIRGIARKILLHAGDSFP